MWVKFKKTYSGREGLFAKGTLHNLPDSKLKAIGKGYYKTSPSPQNAHVDKGAALTNKLRIRATELQNEEQHLTKLKANNKRDVNLQEEILKKLLTKKEQISTLKCRGTEKQNQTLCLDRMEFEISKAEGVLQAIKAFSSLNVMDLTEAQCKLRAVKKQITDIAGAKKKAEKKAKTMADNKEKKDQSEKQTATPENKQLKTEQTK